MVDSFDLSSLDLASKSDAGVEFVPTHPVDHTPLPLSFTLAGENSAKVQQARRKATNRRLRQRGRVVLTAEELEFEATEHLAICILGWQNVQVDGADYPYSHENAVALLGDRRFAWLRRQIDEFVADASNFI